MEETPGKTALGSEEPTNAPAAEKKEVDWEKRYKDTQKHIEERALENKSLAAKNEALAKQLNEITTPSIEVTDEIEDLKFTDPDAWRREINRLEQEALQKTTAERNEILKQVEGEAASEYELDRRKSVLGAFQVLNPDLVVTDEILANDVPPRISKRLETGETNFEEFLNEVKDYLTADRVTPKVPLQDDPNLAAIAGGSDPSLEAKKGDSKQSYATEIY